MALLGCGAFVVPMQAAQSIRPWHTDEEVSKSIVVPSIPERIDSLSHTDKGKTHHLSEVLVKASRPVVSSNVVAKKISAVTLERNLGRSLAQMLTEVSGVTMLQTGTTTAKPVIHGMYGTRVLIMNNGVRQSGQQWGEDHAPEVSVDANDEVHVLKGAEAVAYGSEAIAGVILLGQKSLPAWRKS